MGKPTKSSNTGEELHAAARSGDLNTVKSICSSDPLAINSRDKHSRTPLHLASWAGQAEVVSHLCKHKADVGAAAVDDMAAIHFAAQKGHLEVVRTLHQSGVSVRATNRKGMTPLHYAVQGSHLELTQYLLKKGANLTAKTKAGKSPLDLASKEEIRSSLIEWEKSSLSNNKGGPDGEGQGEESGLKQTLGEKAEEEASSQSEVEATPINNEEEFSKERKMKRRLDEIGMSESLSEPKKARVALNHLLVKDDTHEDYEGKL